MNFRPREFVTYIVVVSYDQPNTFAEVPADIIWKFSTTKKGWLLLYPEGRLESISRKDVGKMEQFSWLIICALSLHDPQPPKATTRTNIPGLSGSGLFEYNVGSEFAWLRVRAFSLRAAQLGIVIAWSFSKRTWAGPDPARNNYRPEHSVTNSKYPHGRSVI